MLTKSATYDKSIHTHTYTLYKHCTRSTQTRVQTAAYNANYQQLHLLTYVTTTINTRTAGIVCTQDYLLKQIDPIATNKHAQ